MVIAHEAPPITADASGVCRVGGTRITLETILTCYRDGAGAEEIANRFPAVSLADIHATIAYYLHHRSEVDAYLAKRERQAEQVRARIEAAAQWDDFRQTLESRLRAKRP